MAVEQTTVDGVEIVILKNDRLEARLAPACGSNVYSLIDGLTGYAILGEPSTISAMKERPFSYGIPVLFPPNRIEGGSFEWNGKTYALDMTFPHMNQHIHGIVGREAWELVLVEDEDIPRAVTRLRSWEHPNVFRQWQHNFELRMTVELDGTVLRQRVEIDNMGEDAMPWGLGYHTRFRMPISPDGSAEECVLTASVDGQWELGPTNLPTGKLLPLSEGRNLPAGLPGNVPLDDLFRATAPNTATYTDPHAGIMIVYRASPEFIHWIVFNHNLPHVDYTDHVCFEPYTWMSNAPKVPIPADESGVKSLQPGQSVTCTTELHVEHVAH